MGLREILGRMRGERWFDGKRLWMLRDAVLAAKLKRPTTSGVESVEPCARCNRAMDERIITTGTSHGDPLVWDTVPIAVDGWACTSCDAVLYPKAMSPEESVRLGEAGVAAVNAKRWRDAEWWFTRLVWALPEYAAGHLDLANALSERLASGFDSDPATTSQVRRRRQRALDDAIEAVEARREAHAPALRVAVYLHAAEVAAGERSADRARRILDRLVACEELDPEARKRESDLRAYVDEERWVFADAYAVLDPHLRLMDRNARPIDSEELRARCRRAVESVENYYAEHTTHWQSIWLAAMARAALEEHDVAVDRWKRAWERHPERSEIVREAALALVRADRVVEAREINRDATVRMPLDATLWCNRAVTELLAGDIDEARRCVLESQRLDPNDVIARNLGRRIASLPAGGPWPKTLDELEGRKRN